MSLSARAIKRCAILFDVVFRAAVNKIVELATADGATLATGSPDWSVRLWDVATGNERATFSSHAGIIASVAFSPDQRTLVTVSPGHALAWDLIGGQVRAIGHRDINGPVAISADASVPLPA